MALTECPECKREVSDQAPSCPHCGYPLAEGFKHVDRRSSAIVQTKATEVQWETCQIEWNVTAGLLGQPLPWSKNYFWARAASPVSGPYTAGCSSEFGAGFQAKIAMMGNNSDPRPRSWDKNSMNAFMELSELLTQDGWEPTNFQSSQWWQQGFRRQVRTEEDGWLFETSTPKLWGGRWVFGINPSIPDDLETLKDPEVQQALTDGNIRQDSEGYWATEEYWINFIRTQAELAGGKVQLVSNIKISHEGAHRITFKALMETTDKNG